MEEELWIDVIYSCASSVYISSSALGLLILPQDQTVSSGVDAVIDILLKVLWGHTININSNNSSAGLLIFSCVVCDINWNRRWLGINYVFPC